MMVHTTAKTVLRSRLVAVIALAAAYYYAGRLGLVLRFEGSNVSPVWPASGVAFAAVLALGPHVWPGILIGAFLSHLDTYLANGFRPHDWSALFFPAAIAVGSTLEAMLGLLAVKRIADPKDLFGRGRDVFKFVAIALFMGLVGALVGPFCVCYSEMIPWESYKTVWITWWMGDVGGLLIVAPLFLVWRGFRFHWSLPRFVEGAVLIALLVIVGQLLFGTWLSSDIITSLPYLIIPILLWTAFRFGQRHAVTVTLIVAVLAILGTVKGIGPFARASLNDSLLMVQGFVSVLAVTVLALAAAVDERRRGELDLARQSSLLRMILRQATDAIIVCDATGRITFSNATARRMAHLDLEETTLGGSPNLWGRAFDPHTGKPIDPNKWVLAEALRGQAVFNADARMVRTDGSTYDILIGAAPIRDEKGGITGAVATFTDITERKRIEEALQRHRDKLEDLVRERTDDLQGANENLQREIAEHRRTQQELRASEEKFREMAEMLPEAIFETDESENITFVNRQAFEIFGFTREDVDEGLAVGDMFVPEDRQRVETDFREILAGRQDRQGREYTGRRMDGGAFPVVVCAAPVMRDRQPVGIRGTVVDMTERWQAEEERRTLEAQMQQAQKLESLRVLAGGVAHDFNNMLQVIISGSEFALRDVPSISSAHRDLQETIRVAKRAAGLTKQMLDYSGRGAVSVKSVNLSSIIRERTALFDSLAAGKVPVRYNLAPNLPLVDADASQLQQALVNLIVNAVEAVGEVDGVVTVETGVATVGNTKALEGYEGNQLLPGEYVFLDVTDNGCGMDPRTRSRIFDPFFSTKFTGRGLGLASVLGIVRGHGGAIHADSEAARGTTFRILLPKSEQAPVDVLEAAPMAPSPPRFSKPVEGAQTVLVVDDEDAIRRLVGRILERAGYQILSAADGEEALSMYREHRDQIDVVLMDLTMPHMDGEKALRELRKLDVDLPVILSSGYSESEVAPRFGKRGPSAFIQKPYHSGDLYAVVKAVLASRESKTSAT